jgi:acetyltransferase-like isoleucine patch superfamily enzyme
MLRSISKQNGHVVDVVDRSTLASTTSVAGAKQLDLLEGAGLSIGSDVSFKNNPSIIVRGPGSRLYIADGASLDGTKIVIMGRDCFVYIGPRTQLRRLGIEVTGLGSFAAFGRDVSWESGGCLATGDNLHILVGDDGMISNNVTVRTQDGHGIFDAKTRMLVNGGASVIIEPHVWLGNSSRVNKGVRVGRGSILGGASLATKSMDSNCIYAGVPAVKTRSDIRWSRTYSWTDIPAQYT